MIFASVVDEVRPFRRRPLNPRRFVIGTPPPVEYCHGMVGGRLLSLIQWEGQKVAVGPLCQVKATIRGLGFFAGQANGSDFTEPVLGFPCHSREFTMRPRQSDGEFAGDSDVLE